MHLHRHHLKLALSESADSGGPYEASVITSLQCAIKVLGVASTSYEVLVSPAPIDDPCSGAEVLRQGILVERLPEFTHLVSEAAVRVHRARQRSRLTTAPHSSSQRTRSSHAVGATHGSTSKRRSRNSKPLARRHKSGCALTVSRVASWCVPCSAIPAKIRAQPHPGHTVGAVCAGSRRMCRTLSLRSLSRCRGVWV
jgi:hypothetical protein